MKDKSLIVITNAYPYGFSEVFVEKEMAALSNLYKSILILPLNADSDLGRETGKNTEVIGSLIKISKKTKARLLFKNLFLVSKYFLVELFFSKKPLYILKKIRTNLSILIQAIEKAEILKQLMDSKGLNAKKLHFYSVWVNEGALVLSILKSKGVIDNFVFRFHGYDLYDERWPGKYVPFRSVNMRMVSKALVLSDNGLEYLKKREKHHHKLVRNYNGVFDNGSSPFKESDEVFRIVSCSNLIELKRVELILESIKYLDFKLEWIHFGDGPLMQSLLIKAKTLPENIKVEFKGKTLNRNILEYYASNSINLFIHLSESEGFGVSILEAISFGIPVLACNVGGVPELVNDNTGILLDKDCSVSEIAKTVLNFKNSRKNKIEFRSSVREFWAKNFDAEIKYKEFADLIYIHNENHDHG